MNEIKIVTIESENILTDCAAILVAAYNADPWNDAWTIEKALEKLECFYHSPKFMGFIAYSGHTVVGACVGNIEPYYTGDYFYLKEMFVAPAFQNRGVGQKLMDALKTQLALLGIQQVILFTSCDIFPFKFYEKAAFKEMDGMRMMHFSSAETV